ncbi:oxidoreductase [Streptomyces albireticuli]|uniref:Short-chain dehydrogenase n=1 Tax=Streptomyces albireticuli TaxID=1940 RepID=A0A2A2DHB1_9ACTN|nr:oxidoreductase [Streptomyces albireticuli]MCD9141859.1 SDR family NAD(P)-dependent oxidoreductase [Streptomyces albireticuli]MCD9163197.1 SDR family NAD(P)-dependent oxidoreductase [Streptomyces albireticuli]MCD9190032.1 SDR family NAD(P)-dependent oxidoreductase [Streptomyces albireticuli]PAU50642.1 short-chain dehydrogenase [Streptomyces albireticuli]
MNGWTANDIPDQSGRTAVVTGANSGIGYVTALELARHGAKVVLACRDAARGKAAEERIRAAAPGADVLFAPLDLADLSSVRDFAADLSLDRVDLLVNNAGVMALPERKTVDGFEMQFGTNHLGHFALTGLLLPRLREAGRGARIVNLSSGLHVLGTVDPRDLHMEHRYRRWIAYGRSKSANLLFTHELARRLGAAGSPVVAAAAHPGYASTNLQTAGVRMEERALAERAVELLNSAVAQSAEEGALPVLHAATAPDVRPDDFFGPRLLMWRGAPARSWRAPWTRDDRASAGLWAVSERMTGVGYL